MFYSKKYDYVCWFLVNINVCVWQVASEVSIPEDIVAVKANAKEAVHPNWIRRKWMVRIFVNLNSDLMLQIERNMFFSLLFKKAGICRVGLIHLSMAWLQLYQLFFYSNLKSSRWFSLFSFREKVIALCWYLLLAFPISAKYFDYKASNKDVRKNLTFNVSENVLCSIY